MSRGFGRLQRELFATIRRHAKPMAFDEMRAALLQNAGEEPDAGLNPSFERSVRRALRRLIRDGVLVALGGGGRADPFRYFMSMTSIATVIASTSEEEANALMDALMAGGDRPHGSGDEQA